MRLFEEAHLSDKIPGPAASLIGPLVLTRRLQPMYAQNPVLQDAKLPIHEQLDEVMMPRYNNLPITAYDIRTSSEFHAVGDFQIASERRGTTVSNDWQ
jgi:hypothetical protein